MDANRAPAALTGISVDNYRYPRPAFYIPETMASIIANYHATGTVNGEAVDERNTCLIKLDDGQVSEITDFYGDPETVARQWD